MEISSEIKDIASALSKSQNEFPVFKKDKTVNITTKNGGSFSYTYTDLGTMFSMVMPILSRNGLCFTQCVDHGDGIIIVESWLIHTSGQFFKARLTLPLVDDTKNIVHSIGSSITYARRYAAGALLGVASEQDDDANAAGEGGQKKKKVDLNMPACPNCKKKETVINSKKEYGGGYVCYKTKGGCGAKWGQEIKLNGNGKNGTTNGNGQNGQQQPELCLRDKDLMKMFNLFITNPDAGRLGENQKGPAFLYYASVVLKKEIIDRNMFSDPQIKTVTDEMIKKPSGIKDGISSYIDFINK